MKRPLITVGVFISMISAAYCSASNISSNIISKQISEASAAKQSSFDYFVSIFNAIRDIIVEHLNCDENDVIMDADLYWDLGADSLHILDICDECEDTFDILFEDSDIEKIETVADLYNLVMFYL